MSDFVLLATGAIYAIAHLVFGLGVTRAVAAMKSRPISLLEVFLWPVVLVIIAATGDVA